MTAKESDPVLKAFLIVPEGAMSVKTDSNIPDSPVYARTGDSRARSHAVTGKRPLRSSDEAVRSRVKALGMNAREQLVEGLPVVERRYVLAGISTAVLEGGDGPPILFLHGPGEFGPKWLRIIPDLVKNYRVIAPDLPAHGASETPQVRLDQDRVSAWIEQLIKKTCPAPPVLVGHVLGGTLAARFAMRHPRQISRLVLVDTLGLAPFRPAPRFALTMFHFMAQPRRSTYERFMRQCSLDLDGLRTEMGELWEPFESYTVELSRSPSSKVAGRMMRELGLPPIPPADLARIEVPTDLIWGRQDRANRLRIAEAASARFGWPLHVVEHCADDPARDQPGPFCHVLRHILENESEKTEP